MSKKTIQALIEIRNVLDETINIVQTGGNHKEALRLMNVGLDKQLARLVKELGGESWYYKKNNETAWDLSMGETS